MALFLLKLIPPRPSFPKDMSEREGAVMRLHVNYWQTLMSEGKVLAFGPVHDPDGVWGLGLVSANDLDEARALVEADPALKADIGLTFRLLPTDLHIASVQPSAPAGSG